MTHEHLVTEVPSGQRKPPVEELTAQLSEALSDTRAEWACVLTRDSFLLGNAVLVIDSYQRAPVLAPPLSTGATDALLLATFDRTQPVFANRVSHDSLAGLPDTCPSIRSFALLPVKRENLDLVMVLVNAAEAFASPMINRLHASLQVSAPEPDCPVNSDAGQDFSVHFQAQWNLASGELFGLEAFPRWRDGTPVHASLDAMASAGALAAFTDRLVFMALEHWKTWQFSGLIPVDSTLAINLNRDQLRSPTVIDRLLHGLQQHTLSPARLVIEVRETDWRDELCLDALLALQNAGVKLAIDGFGAEQADLTELARLPVDQIKIGPALLRELYPLEDNAVIGDAITSYVVELARSLVIPIVAVGVESLTIAERLAAIGCQVAQGYALTPPLPAAELPNLLQQCQQQRMGASGKFVHLGDDSAMIEESSTATRPLLGPA